MSATFSFVCDDCKKSCWAGQNTYIYKYDYVADFLHDHLGHRLRFINDLVDDEKAEDYDEVKGDNTCRLDGT